MLYRGWLEFQWREASAVVLQQMSEFDTSGRYTIRQIHQPDDLAAGELWYNAYKQLKAVEAKIMASLAPDNKVIRQVVYQAYRNELSEINYFNKMGVGYTFTEVRGRKTYELINHLGNVLSTVSDRRIAVSVDGVTIDHYEGDITSATDYAPLVWNSLAGRINPVTIDMDSMARKTITILQEVRRTMAPEYTIRVSPVS